MPSLVDALLKLLHKSRLVQNTRIANNEKGEVHTSPLSGKPRQDLKRVLHEIETWLAKQ